MLQEATGQTAMILFSFPRYDHIARQLQSAPLLQPGQFRMGRFENEEWHAKVEQRVSGEHCLVLGTVAPPDDQMLSFLLLAHTLRKEGASNVTGLLPYLAYSRQDKQKPGESLGTAWIGSLLKSSGVDQVMTVDVHSDRDKYLFPVPLVSLSTAKVFARTMHVNGLTDATVVAPDSGAIGRCEAVKKEAAMPEGPTPYFEKARTEKGLVHRGPIGKVGARVVIIDDMIDTGGTLVSACKMLREVGVKEVYIFVTHGLFTGCAWTNLWPLGVKRIFCTDTIHRPELTDERVTILSIVPLLKRKLSEG